MYIADLPSYAALSTDSPHTPSYTPVPQAHERRLALNDRVRARPSGEFVKQTKKGDVSLRLARQDDNAAFPVYGCGPPVEGTVDIVKTDGIASVEVKIEGVLKLQEIAEGGMTTHNLCLSRAVLWVKGRDGDVPCPNSLPFTLSLPTTFSDGGKTYPLPPTYESHLSGLPGFTATIDYSVSAVVVKPNLVPNLVKSALFGREGNWSVSTPLMYRPRSRPSVPLPRPLITNNIDRGFAVHPGWKTFPSSLKARTDGGQDIISKLYLPASRIFAIGQPVPFHLTFNSSANSLAAFLPYGPVASSSRKKQFTRIQLFRQTTVDVRNAIISGTKTDIWRVDCVGDGIFRHAGDGPDWISYSGEICIDEQVKIGGFKAGGFSIKDCVVLSMTPPDVLKSPFRDFRQVVPIRIATDPWTEDGAGVGAYSTVYRTPSSSDDHDDALHMDYDRFMQHRVAQ